MVLALGVVLFIISIALYAYDVYSVKPYTPQDTSSIKDLNCTTATCLPTNKPGKGFLACSVPNNCRPRKPTNRCIRLLSSEEQ